MSLLPIKKPESGRPVRAVIKHFSKWLFESNVHLVAVNEDDNDWRFVEDNCELAHEWNVIYWEYS